MNATAETERVLDTLYAAFFGGDAAGMAALLDDDVAVRFLGQVSLRGRQEAERFFAFNGGNLTDLDFRIRRRVVDGEWAAVLWDESGTVTATGEPWENHGVDVFRVQDGRITVLHENNDCRIVRRHLPRYPGEQAAPGPNL
jgi:ketosteroid isomerase-like protein